MGNNNSTPSNNPPSIDNKETVQKRINEKKRRDLVKCYEQIMSSAKNGNMTTRCTICKSTRQILKDLGYTIKDTPFYYYRVGWKNPTENTSQDTTILSAKQVLDITNSPEVRAIVFGDIVRKCNERLNDGDLTCPTWRYDSHSLNDNEKQRFIEILENAGYTVDDLGDHVKVL